MPRTQHQEVIYTRGEFQLVQRPNRPSLEIYWYDRNLQRYRYLSAGTSEAERGKHALDNKYLEATKGIECCPTCRRPYDTERRMTALEAIEVYLAASEEKPSYKAIESRIAHVLDYIETLHHPDPLIAEIDEAWIARFRKWAAKRPVISPAGNKRQRALSTIENSVLQLSAAIRHCKQEPQFKTIQMKTLNRTPAYRASVEDLARMFSYALTPKKKRDNLLAFLRVSVVTLGRPDAVHDASTDPKRRQWDEGHGIFNLNPAGRHQTKKYRATVPIARQAVWLFNSTSGHLVKGNAKKAMAAMARELGLPGGGEAGLKLIRRSMANLVRERLEASEKPTDQLEVFLGHRVVGSVSELYAPFSPSYLSTVRGIVEDIIDDLEVLAPGAFCDKVATRPDNVVELHAA